MYANKRLSDFQIKMFNSSSPPSTTSTHIDFEIPLQGYSRVYVNFSMFYHLIYCFVHFKGDRYNSPSYQRNISPIKCTHCNSKHQLSPPHWCTTEHQSSWKLCSSRHDLRLPYYTRDTFQRRQPCCIRMSTGHLAKTTNNIIVNYANFECF